MKKRTIVIIIAGAVLCTLFIGCTVAAIAVYSQTFGRVKEHPEDTFFSYHRWNEIDQTRYARDEVRFNSAGNRLQGFVYGESNNNGLVVISEGLGGTADDYLSMIMYFVDNGWRVFAFNNTGVAGSEGDGIRGLTQSLLDLDAALTYIENSPPFNGLPIMLAGHSWGGYAVCAVLNYNHRINAVVSFAGYNKCADVFNEQGELMVGGIFYTLTPQFWAIEKQLFGDTAKLTAVEGINNAGIPVMIVQCANDEAIPAATTSIYAHRGEIRNPHARIVYREGADATGHEYVFCSPAQKVYMDSLIESWQAYKAAHENPSQQQWADEISFDKYRANELDAELMKSINDLFNSSK